MFTRRLQMVKKVDFSIHDIVKFRIFDKKGYLRNYVQQYEYFAVSDCNPDLSIHIGKFRPDLEGCSVLDDRYYVKDNYFYCSDSRKLSKWKLELKGFENDNLEVNIETNIFGRFSSIINIIDFLLHYTLNAKGCPIIHSSGVCKGENAFLFAGRSGGGKTTLATYFLEKGFDYLGDNFMVLKNGTAHSFVSPLNVFTYNLTPLIQKNLGTKRLSLYFKSMLYKITGGYIKIFTKLNIAEILEDKVKPHAEISKVFLMIPGKEFKVNQIGLDEMVEHLLYNMKLEFFHMPFLTYISSYSYMYPKSGFAKHWDTYLDNLKSNLNNKLLYKIEVPIKYDEKIVEQIYKLID